MNKSESMTETTRDVEGLPEQLDEMAERDGCERYEENDEPCEECDACLVGRAAAEIRRLRSGLETSERERDAARREAYRWEKQLNGLEDETVELRSKLERRDVAVRDLETLRGRLDRQLRRIARLGMDPPPSMERGDFHRDQLMAAVGIAARATTVQEAIEAHATGGDE